MGRRSSHSSDELRELILRETTSLVEERGLNMLSAREIARRIEYSPGTLYNVFENLDDLVITIEGRLLDRLTAALDEAVVATLEMAGRQRVLALLEAYLAFALRNKQLWRLLGEHQLSALSELPAWYQEKLRAIQSRIAQGLSLIFADPDDPARLDRASYGLWVVVHGIAGLSTCSKLNVLSPETARDMLVDLVETYIDGLVSGKN